MLNYLSLSFLFLQVKEDPMFVRKSDVADMELILKTHEELFNINYILPGTLLVD